MMMKYLISLYIVVILLMAGMAHAEGDTLAFSRVQNSSQISLPVARVQVDSAKDVLKISGPISSSCFSNIRAIARLDSAHNEAFIAVSGDAKQCVTNVSQKNVDINSYEVVVDLKAFFSENPVAADSVVHMVVDNYEGDVYAFNYIAKKTPNFKFDTFAQGIIERDASNKYFLVNGNSATPILARFDLRSYENKPVLLKAVIPGNFVIGHQSIPSNAQMIIGQLVALK
jgi:hypothetical protein